MERGQDRTGWYYSTDGGEIYQGTGEQDREDAIAEAEENLDCGDTFTTAYCEDQPLKLSSFIDTERMIEDACERASEDHCGENGEGDDVFPMTREQTLTLESMIEKAVSEWQEIHDLHYTSYYFSKCSKEEDHVVKADADTIRALNTDAQMVAMSYFLLGHKSKLSFEGHGAEFKPTSRMRAALDVLRDNGVARCDADENGRETWQGLVAPGPALKGVIVDIFDWIEMHQFQTFETVGGAS